MELLIILEMAQIVVGKYIDGDSEMTYAVPDPSGPGYEMKHC